MNKLIFLTVLMSAFSINAQTGRPTRPPRPPRPMGIVNPGQFRFQAQNVGEVAVQHDKCERGKRRDKGLVVTKNPQNVVALILTANRSYIGIKEVHVGLHTGVKKYYPQISLNNGQVHTLYLNDIGKLTSITVNCWSQAIGSRGTVKVQALVGTTTHAQQFAEHQRKANLWQHFQTIQNIEMNVKGIQGKLARINSKLKIIEQNINAPLDARFGRFGNMRTIEEHLNDVESILNEIQQTQQSAHRELQVKPVHHPTLASMKERILASLQQNRANIMNSRRQKQDLAVRRTYEVEMISLEQIRRDYRSFIRGAGFGHIRNFERRKDSLKVNSTTISAAQEKSDLLNDIAKTQVDYQNYLFQIQNHQFINTQVKQAFLEWLYGETRNPDGFNRRREEYRNRRRWNWDNEERNRDRWNKEGPLVSLAIRIDQLEIIKIEVQAIQVFDLNAALAQLRAEILTVESTFIGRIANLKTMATDENTSEIDFEVEKRLLSDEISSSYLSYQSTIYQTQQERQLASQFLLKLNDLKFEVNRVKYIKAVDHVSRLQKEIEGQLRSFNSRKQDLIKMVATNDENFEVAKRNLMADIAKNRDSYLDDLTNYRPEEREYQLMEDVVNQMKNLLTEVKGILASGNPSNKLNVTAFFSDTVTRDSEFKKEFNVAKLPQLLASCQKALDKLKFPSNNGVDLIQIEVNGVEIKETMNLYSWWTTKEDICQALVDAVSNGLKK